MNIKEKILPILKENPSITHDALMKKGFKVSLRYFYTLREQVEQVSPSFSKKRKKSGAYVILTSVPSSTELKKVIPQILKAISDSVGVRIEAVEFTDSKNMEIRRKIL